MAGCFTRAKAMMGMDDAWTFVRWLHVLAMALFVGGQLFLVVAVVPVTRASGDRLNLRSIARRFGIASLAAVGVLLATGSAMATRDDLWQQGTLHVKLGLVALVGILITWHMRRPERHVLEVAIFIVSLVIVWLGLALAH